MSNVVIQIKGDKQVIKYLVSEFPDRLRSVIIAGLIESLKTAETEAIKLAPVKTGMLRRSIGSVVATFKNKQMRAELFAGSRSVNYAAYQEYGTYDKSVNPDSLKQIQAALRTGIRPGGNFVRVGTIKSEKGIAPKLYLHGGVINAMSRMEEIFKIKLRNLIDEINRKKQTT